MALGPSGEGQALNGGLAARLFSPARRPAAGVLDGVTLGTPIAVLVRNTDQRSADYSEMSVAYRPSHADATYDFKVRVWGRELCEGARIKGLRREVWGRHVPLSDRPGRFTKNAAHQE